MAKRKSKQTKKDKYDDENYNNRELCSQTKKERYNDEKYNNREKFAETCIRLFGVPYHPYVKTHKISKPTLACHNAIGISVFIFNAILY